MELKSFVHDSSWLHTEHGWGNGYVILPPDHPCYKMDYDDIDVDVHGGLTFASHIHDIANWDVEGIDKLTDGWVVGFDTAHLDDTQENWPKEMVLAETEHLRKQLENYPGWKQHQPKD